MDGCLLVHGSMPKVQNSEHFPLSSETEKNAGESMLMMWLLARPSQMKWQTGRNAKGFTVGHFSTPLETASMHSEPGRKSPKIVD